MDRGKGKLRISSPSRLRHAKKKKSHRVRSHETKTFFNSKLSSSNEAPDSVLSNRKIGYKFHRFGTNFK